MWDSEEITGTIFDLFFIHINTEVCVIETPNRIQVVIIFASSGQFVSI
jgi:hypothetical protein